MQDAQPGRQLGRYRLSERLWSGAAGGEVEAWSATDTRLDRTVVVLLLAATADAAARSRFAARAADLARLDSPHLIAVQDHDEADGQPYVVLQHATGVPLSALLANGPLPAGEALSVAAQVARGIADTHRQQVGHGAIDPSAVMVRDPGTPRVHAYLGSFPLAVASATAADDLTALGRLLRLCLAGQAGAPLPPGLPLADDVALMVRRLEAAGTPEGYAEPGAARADLERLAARASAAPGAGPQGTVLRGAVPPPPPPYDAAQPATVPSASNGDARRRRPLWPVLVAAVVVLAILGGVALGWALIGGDDTGPSAEPDPEPTVRGDLDGDGLGDVQAMQVRQSDSTAYRTVTLTSTGDGFEEPVLEDIEPRPYLFVDGSGQYADVDGDGAVDQVWADFGNGELVVDVELADGDPWHDTMDLDPRLIGISPILNTGDLTGDGRDDLVVSGSYPANESSDDLTPEAGGRAGVFVAPAEDDGFGDLTQWFAGDTAISLQSTAVGDFDGDGDDDVLSGGEYGPGDLEIGEDPSAWVHEYQFLLSDGETLEAATEPTEVPYAQSRWGIHAVGDFDGDGADEPAIAGQEGFTSLAIDGDTLTTQTLYERTQSKSEWRNAMRSFGVVGAELWSISDVDGDGDDDLVSLGIANAQAYSVHVFVADDGTLVGPEDRGIAPCEECTDSWRLVRPALTDN